MLFIEKNFKYLLKVRIFPYLWEKFKIRRNIWKIFIEWNCFVWKIRSVSPCWLSLRAERLRGTSRITYCICKVTQRHDNDMRDLLWKKGFKCFAVADFAVFGCLLHWVNFFLLHWVNFFLLYWVNYTSLYWVNF